MSSDRDKEIAKKCWKHGSEALAKQNWDLAIQMFFQASEKDPANVFYRQNLRGAEEKKYGGNGKGASFSGTKLMGVRSRVKKARGKEEWAALDVAAEEGLKVNPWDVDLNTAVAEAAEAREHWSVARFGYEKALGPNPEDKKLLGKYGDLLEEMKEFKEAIAVVSKLQRLDPENNDIGRKLSHLTTEQMIHRTGADEAETGRDLQKNATAYDEADGTGAAVDGPGQDPESDLKRAIRKAPDDADNYVKLADLYAKQDDLTKAVAAMKKASELNDADAIRERYEDLEIAEFRQRIDRDKQKARQLKDEGRMQRVRKQEAKLTDREIEVLTARTERHPKNMRVKFDLGSRLLARKEIAKAIPLLQQSAADTRFEAEALVALGEAFLQDKKLPLARRQFEKALEKLNVHDQQDQFLKSHYALGRIAEAAGDAKIAERHYSDVLGSDYNYRDANERLTKLAGGA